MAASPADAAVHANMRSAIDEALDALSPREAKVLRMRFGIDTTSDHTLEELGKQFDLTRERIRRIASKATRKLMHPSRADKLRQFLDQWRRALRRRSGRLSAVPTRRSPSHSRRDYRGAEGHHLSHPRRSAAVAGVQDA